MNSSEDSPDGRSEIEVLLENNSLSYVATRLLSELPHVGLGDLDLRFYMSNILDVILYQNLRTPSGFISGPVAVVASEEQESIKMKRFRRVRDYLVNIYGLRSILYIHSTKPEREKDSLGIFWSKNDLGLLLNSVDAHKRKLPWPKESVWVNRIISEQQSYVSHDEDRNRDLKSAGVFIKDLSDAYSHDNLVLFLGAGVSINAGGPSWSNLLLNLKSSLLGLDPKSHSISQDDRKHLSTIFEFCEYSDPLIDAQILYHGLKKKYEGSIKEIIYGGEVRRYLERLNSGQKRDGYLLTAISQLCKKHPVKAIVTYNWDDLLEQTFRKDGVPFYPVADDGFERIDDCIPIFHVHGSLPQTGDSIIPNGIVFNEEEYQALYHNPYSWINHIQIQMFRENVCMFIGLSMKDPNLRRLLRIASARNEFPMHVACLKRDSADCMRETMYKKMKKLARLDDNRVDPRTTDCMNSVLAGTFPNDSDFEHKMNRALRVFSKNIQRDFKEMKIHIAWMFNHDVALLFLKCLEDATP